MIGFTPNRFRLEFFTINNPLGTRERQRWEVLTWDEAIAKAKERIEIAGDPVLAVKIVTIDPFVPDDE